MIHRNLPKNQSAHNEAGMVSIIVTVILMFVISITVLGFAQIIRREQRQALDNQLSNQAFYAAESGINDARQVIANSFAGTVPDSKTSCGPSPTGPYSSLTGTIDSATQTSYSCLLIDGSPKSLQYDLSTSQPSKVFPIFSDATRISSLEFDWSSSRSTDPTVGCSTFVSNQLPPATAWTCGYGMIRVDLVPFDVNNNNRSDLMNNDFVSFFTPLKGSTTPVPTVSYTSGTNIYGTNVNQGSRPGAHCDGNLCKIKVTNLSGNRYYVRAMAIYSDAKLSVTAYDASGNKLSLSGAQVMIDSTGKANDVLRRVQVRLPLVHDGLHGDYGVQSTDSLCKQFYTAWGNSNNSGC